jgi:hypothetical protein
VKSVSPSNTGSPKGRIVAHASADTEVFLIDHDFRLVTRSVGPLDALVDPGLYKVKFRRGQITREAMIALVPGEAEQIVPTPAGLDAADALAPAPDVAAASAPLPVAAGDVAPAGEIDSALVVFIAAPDSPDAATGLSVADAAGRELLDIGGAGSRSSSGIAARLPLPAGSYRLRLAIDAGTLEQSVVLARNWETRVEIGTKAVATSSGASVVRADLGDASIYMTQGPRDHTEARSYARLVRAWLAGPQETIATSHAERLLTAGITEPLFAICVAHTLVRQEEAEKRRGKRPSRPRRKLVKDLLAALQALVPTHPDVEALSVWLGRNPAAPFALPPMLVSSWDVLAGASAQRPGVIPAGSLAALIAEHLWTSPVWLQWRADRIEAPTEPITAIAPQARATLISQVIGRAAGASGDTREALSDLERAVLETVKQGNLSESVRSFGAKAVKRLGVPSATFDRALATLARKLGP